MRRTTIITGTVFPLALLALSGCFKLGRDTPVLRQYVLGGTPATPAAAGAPASAGLTVGLRRLDLASYLALPAVVVRRGAHQIVVSEFHRWGEAPEEGINRAVARYLAGERGIGGVDVAPWSAGTAHDYLVQLHVTRFEGAASEAVAAAVGEAHVQVSWEIFRQPAGVLVARGATDYHQPGWTVGDYGALVMLLDRGLMALARDLATCLGRSAADATAGRVLSCEDSGA